MLSIIIASFKEPDTIGKAISSIADHKYSGIKGSFEIIQVSPDQETLRAGAEAAQNLLLGDRFTQIVDPNQGKPAALNLALSQAKGDIVIMTDGDTYFGKGAVAALVKPFEDTEIGGVSGRPIADHDRSSFWNYIANFFTHIADLKRKEIYPTRRDGYQYSDGVFPMSGYILAIRNIDITLPSDLIVDDSYITHLIHSAGYKLAYTPTATSYVKFPLSLADYIKQRRRNIIGHMELKKYEELGTYKNARTLASELRYLVTPLRFAKSSRELYYSLLIYLLRGYTWLVVIQSRLMKRSIMKKNGWDRVSSTK